MIISRPSSSSIRMVTEPLIMKNSVSERSPAQMVLCLAAERRLWQCVSSLSRFLILGVGVRATMVVSRKDCTGWLDLFLSSGADVDTCCTAGGNAPFRWRQLTRHILTRLANLSGNLGD